MVELSLEPLITRGRQEYLAPEEMSAQIDAVKKFVGAASHQLEIHQIDRDAGSNRCPESKRFDSFFSIPKLDAVMMITSVGLPNVDGYCGLFVEIYKSNKEEVRRILYLQTAKTPNFVGKYEALFLSCYTPATLEMLSGIIERAIPIDKSEYYGIVRPNPAIASH